MATAEIGMLWNIVKDVRSRLSDKNDQAIDALGAIRKAFNYIYDYLVNNKGAYQPNMQLADLWNDASTAVMRVDRSLGDMLASKSRFWAHPQIYEELNRSVDVLTLSEITDQMEHLRQRIR
ncbi:hypothetical protein [Mucilaginibacter flavidus]|uniref:hypothetical protein n=1 Tax=Mucilaginibacter flavidus TaxID=2949309 RepID=UPI002093ED06|nr:hypothetical protein [Mucilaginibacter flavidus]MCO5950905.1 hypothetical protein [Mucilaginibacter flavidus]